MHLFIFVSFRLLSRLETTFSLLHVLGTFRGIFGAKWTSPGSARTRAKEPEEQSAKRRKEGREKTLPDVTLDRIGVSGKAYVPAQVKE